MKIIIEKNKNLDEGHGLSAEDKAHLKRIVNFLLKSNVKVDKTKDLSKEKKKEKNEGKDPKKGTGKKPKGSGRRLYTDENPSDTVSVKFSTVKDIRDTLSKASFKSKSHKRQSQIINLIHQRVRVAKERTKDPAKKKNLTAAYNYISKRKEASKRKTQRMKSESVSPEMQQMIVEELENLLNEKCWPGYEKKGMKTMFGKRYPNCVKKSKKKGKKRRKNENIEEHDISELLELDEILQEYELEELLAMNEEDLEESLRDWFGKSSGKTKSGRRVRGWVQVGGKYDGAPCAKQPGQKTKPKCVSSAKRRSMSKKERDSAARRKRKKDPNPNRRGKPKNVSTDPQRKRKRKKRKNE